MPAKPWPNSPPQEQPPGQNPCQKTEHDVLEMAVAVIASVTIHGCLGLGAAVSPAGVKSVCEHLPGGLYNGQYRDTWKKVLILDDTVSLLESLQIQKYILSTGTDLKVPLHMLLLSTRRDYRV